MSSTVHIPLIPIRESSKRAAVFTIELPRRQVLSPALMNPDIITGLVHKHTTIEPMVVQKLDEKNTFLVFTEGKDIKKLCSTLQSIKMWLGHSINTGRDVATHEQMIMGAWLHRVGREESVLVEGTNTQLPRPMPEPQCNISCPGVASQVVGKFQNLAHSVQTPPRRGKSWLHNGLSKWRVLCKVTQRQHWGRE